MGVNNLPKDVLLQCRHWEIAVLRKQAAVTMLSTPYPTCLGDISWTTATEPALAASPAADQLQTRQTLLPGYFFPAARLPH